MSDLWYVRKAGGEEYGPVTILELSQWANEGRIDQDTVVKQGYYGDWTPAAQVVNELSGRGHVPQSTHADAMPAPKRIPTFRPANGPSPATTNPHYHRKKKSAIPVVWMVCGGVAVAVVLFAIMIVTASVAIQGGGIVTKDQAYDAVKADMERREGVPVTISLMGYGDDFVTFSYVAHHRMPTGGGAKYHWENGRVWKWED